MNRPVDAWEGQRAWIVGASTGIGAALATHLIDRGCRVALSARRTGPLERITARAPDRTLVLPLDVTDARAVSAAHGTLCAQWSGVDMAFVVAGQYQPMRAWDLALPVFRSQLEVNVMGAVNVVLQLLPGFLAGGHGRIVLVSSVAGYRALPKALAYGTTKAALTHFAEGLYLDLAPRGIAVHVVHPGFVRTPLTAGNDFRMPALISAEDAAAEMLRGLERGEFEIHYPKRFTWWMKVLRVLPYRWYFPLVHRLTGL
ncbi:MAG: SDR family NAD(P)-dependent oxidoreductase [Burkholderiales bacterium]